MQKKSKFGFSLIELSVVILVIGILVIGITQGSRIIKEANLKSGQALTKSSAVGAIDGILLWLEPSDLANFKTSTVANEPTTNYGNIANGNPVSAWLDRNPQASTKINMVTSTDIKRPTFISTGINNLPSVDFDGTDDFLQISGILPLITAGDNSYTIVVVWKGDSFAATQVIAAQGANSSNGTGGIVTNSSGNIGFWGNSNDYYPTAVKVGTPYITIVRVDNTQINNISVFNNTNTSSTGASSGGNTSLSISANSPFRLAISPYSSAFPFNGFISEVIVFNRNLKQTEIVTINNYLSQKYAIKVS